MNITKLLQKFIFFALISTVSQETWAVSYNETTCDDTNGLQCWVCGNDCKATLYDGGKLIISGTGAMRGGDNPNVTWTSSNPNLARAVTSVEFKEGITHIGTNALWHVSTVQEITLADSIQSIQPDGIATGSSIRLIMTENSLLNDNANYSSFGSNVSKIFCRGDIERCRESKQSLFPSTVIFTDEIYDKEGNLLEKCSSSGCLKYDTNGNISGRYDFDGNQIGSYKYDAGGNLVEAVENGNVIYRRRIYTPLEATAAVQNNKNTFSIIYR